MKGSNQLRVEAHPMSVVDACSSVRVLFVTFNSSFTYVRTTFMNRREIIKRRKKKRTYSYSPSLPSV